MIDIAEIKCAKSFTNKILLLFHSRAIIKFCRILYDSIMTLKRKLFFPNQIPFSQKKNMVKD